MQVLCAPDGWTFKAAIATDADTLEVWTGDVHLYVAHVPVDVRVGVSVCLEADDKQIAVEGGVQIVKRGAVSFHLDAVVTLCVDDVDAAEISDVGEVTGDVDMLPDDVLLLDTGGGFCRWLVLCRR